MIRRSCPTPAARRATLAAALLLAGAARASHAQGASAPNATASAMSATPTRTAAPPLAAPADVQRIQLAPGRSFPLSFTAPVTRVSVASADVADVVVVSDRDVVINGKTAGETDVLLWSGGQRRHFRVTVAPAADRAQVVLGVKIAEVRRDALRAFGTSLLARGTSAQGRSGQFNAPNVIDSTGIFKFPSEPSRFLSVLTEVGTRDLVAFIQAEQQKGTARALAEPTLTAANREEANFLVGGEVPIPIAQPGPNGQVFVTIVFREFGVRLAFVPEILGDSIVKLKVKPEVSSLDYSNAVTLSGFRIPALRTRRLESTVDVRRDQSIVLSGLFNDERTRVRTGIPGLMDVPVLGALFGSTTWQRNESELLIVVTPMVLDPTTGRVDALPLVPETRLPAAEAIAPRLPGGVAPSAAPSAATPRAATPRAATPPATPPAAPSAPSTVRRP